MSALVPLYGFLEGDTIGLILLVHEDDPIARVIARLQHSARWRVAKFENARAFHAGRELDPTATVAEAGLSALERVDVRASRGVVDAS
ncbi:MAG TPA: toluene-4-monooxygenase system B family protein [Myxococcota bacterium]|nr:toluene-4-monooxygenase system B family protein [Myxococcota bacterium]